jgi:hypothetical protein
MALSAPGEKLVKDREITREELHELVWSKAQRGQWQKNSVYLMWGAAIASQASVPYRTNPRRSHLRPAKLDMLDRAGQDFALLVPKGFEE